METVLFSYFSLKHKNVMKRWAFSDCLLPYNQHKIVYCQTILYNICPASTIKQIYYNANVHIIDNTNIYVVQFSKNSSTLSTHRSVNRFFHFYIISPIITNKKKASDFGRLTFSSCGGVWGYFAYPNIVHVNNNVLVALYIEQFYLLACKCCESRID